MRLCDYDKLMNEKGSEYIIEKDYKYIKYKEGALNLNPYCNYEFSYTILEAITFLKPGDQFGEISLLYDKPR